MIDRRSKRDVLNDECSHMLDVCCEISNIKETYPIATKCGVLNPNGVGVKMNDITDGQAQFGKVNLIIIKLSL